MTRTKVILFVSFLLVFAAGASLGLVAAKPAERSHHRSWLADRLNLTPQQRDQMETIWREAEKEEKSTFKQRSERRTAAAQQRDQAILALLSEDQRTQYEAIRQEHARKMEELSSERDQAVEQAVEQTKKILTPEQAQKYEELRKGMRERATSGPSSGRYGPRYRRPAPASEPTTNEQRTPRVGE